MLWIVNILLHMENAFSYIIEGYKKEKRLRCKISETLPQSILCKILFQKKKINHRFLEMYGPS